MDGGVWNRDVHRLNELDLRLIADNATPLANQVSVVELWREGDELDVLARALDRLISHVLQRRAMKHLVVGKTDGHLRSSTPMISHRFMRRMMPPSSVKTRYSSSWFVILPLTLSSGFPT